MDTGAWKRLIKDVHKARREQPRNFEIRRLMWLYDHGDRSDLLYHLLNKAVPFEV